MNNTATVKQLKIRRASRRERPRQLSNTARRTGSFKTKGRFDESPRHWQEVFSSPLRKAIARNELLTSQCLASGIVVLDSRMVDCPYSSLLWRGARARGMEKSSFGVLLCVAVGLRLLCMYEK